MTNGALTEAGMLQVAVEHSADTAILHCVGRIVAGDEADVLKAAVMCQASRRVVLLDLAGVETVDAAGLGLLIFLQTTGYAVGFELQLTNPTRRVRELLELTRLDSVFETVVYSAEPQFSQSTDNLNTPASLS
jgi:anti-sigma B factor antagonist